MLTVRHTTTHSDHIYEAISVEHFPHDRRVHIDTPIERTQPASVFLQFERHDDSGKHLYGGSVYVMNSDGQTVAQFHFPTQVDDPKGSIDPDNLQ